ncbi:phospholipid methyltransferase-domain-containing protein [Fusarium flagelliforme]|uniref:phospholipid methyltransferase-domain-containing protein n=1 Tax=Fusarium flagelliforme TaxID=2675880 RepID=UPI001E8EF029|nr:phospholipid methyltransferase-domain-containing protein [Fusarium flagelliforme]KAH7185623.1 phospholipid methyltransferase-domain-containing protein [Fusarium flagelliforme]
MGIMALGPQDFIDYVNYDKKSLYISAASIAFNPLFWNIVARQEYHNKLLTKLFGRNSKAACYALAFTIFSLGMVRDLIYKNAIFEQPTHPALVSDFIQAAAAALFIVGNVLVVSSTWRLGITGTFLGDYFGILMDEMVTGFPFNVTGSPMYTGSTCSFLATAMWYGKPAGVLLTMWVHLVYRLALQYEDPFTSEIYAKRERERAAGKKSN